MFFLLYLCLVYILNRWWKDLKVETNFSFARDRIVECYLWTLGVYFEPQFSVGRKLLTKVTAISSILDDIYDAYGTFEELQVLTPAIQRSLKYIAHYIYIYCSMYYLLFQNIVQIFFRSE